MRVWVFDSMFQVLKVYSFYALCCRESSIKRPTTQTSTLALSWSLCCLQALAVKKTSKGKTMYIVADPDANKGLRMMQALKGEGMPTVKNPFVHGNLFLIFTIDFPESLSVETQSSLRKMLPPPLNKPKFKEDDKDVEVHTLTHMDPVASFNENKINMKGGGEAYDDEDDDDCGMRSGPGQHVQCNQQ